MRFSVIMPVYKVEDYLKEAVDSVLNQTYKDFELILVDDGSPDGCPKICDEYAQKDKRVKVIHKENGGVSSARNEGIKVAQGEYLAFVDSDDYISVDLFSKLEKTICDSQPDIIQFGYCIFNDNGILSNGKNSDKEVNQASILKAFIWGDITREVWNKIYKRTMFSNIIFPVGRIAEDLAVNTLVLEKCNKVICSSEVLYFYRVRNNSYMTSGSIKLFYDVMITHYEIYLRYERTQYVKILYTNYYNNLMKLYAKCYYENDIQYIDEVKERIANVNFRLLKFKSKLVYIVYKANKGILLKILCEKYIK